MTFVPPPTSLLRVWLFRPRSAFERGAQLGLVGQPREVRHLLSSSARDRRTFSREEEKDWSNLLLRNSLSRSCGGLVPPEAFVFDREPKGKPIVDWGPTLFQAGLPEHSALRSRIAFNLSHTEGMLACAVLYDASERDPGSELSVGIDVESCHRRTKRGARRIAERRLAAPELEWISRDEAEKALEERFLQVWTLKEAYLKATGDGLASSLGLKGFSVQIGEETCNELIERVSEAIGSVHDETKPLRILLEDRSPDAAGREIASQGEGEHVRTYTRSAAGCGWRSALFNIEDTHLLALCYNLGWRRGAPTATASNSSVQSGCRLRFSSTVPLLGPDRALDELTVLAAML